MFLTSIIRLINIIVPKDPHSVYCRSTFLYPDNVDAIIIELLKSEKNFRIYCEEPHVIFEDKRIHKIRNRLDSLFHYVRSKYIFWDTGMFGNPKPIKSQITVNLWHGVSFKKIGYYLSPEKKKTPTSTFVVAYSDMFSEIMSNAFGVDSNNVLITGEPRNDFLFSPVEDDLLNEIGIRDLDKRIVIWMPTYRQSKYGNSNDGKEYDFGFPIIGVSDLVRLNQICGQIGITLILKWHALQILPRSININELDNILFLTSERLEELSIPLNSLLARCDALLTDYSSVFINYMLLDRPIGFAYDDIDNYMQNRGFMFDNIERYMPGKKINDYNALISFLYDVSRGIDSYQDKRKTMKFVLNKYYDDKNSKRLLEHIGIIL